ncbi:MAG: hypothetical protein LBR19_06375, partial [Bifidobacteriaceae bacterium]|nr:hypothetical protein [Bifidobacteriaceae bacterium]
MNKPVDLAAQARQAAAELLAVPPDTIQDLTPLDAGPTPTNNSFTFKLGTQQLLVRLPGPGTEGLIDRAAERAAYQALAPHGLADEVLALDQAGRRITVFYPDARVADGAADADLALCMA